MTQSTLRLLRVPSLTLHDVTADGDTAANDGDPFYRIRVSEFEDLLSRLRKRGYRTISSRQFRAWQRSEAVLPERPVVLTFDDGYSSHFDVVTPLLVRYRFTGTFFVTTDFVGRPGYVTWDHLRKMIFMGMEIGSHGKTHRPLTGLSAKELEKELSEPKRVLEAELGVPVRAIAAPGGFWSRAVEDNARRVGYDAAWISEIGLNRQETRAFALKRLPIHQGLALDRLMAMAEGHRRLLWIAIARQMGIRVLKAVLGVGGYEHLKRLMRPDA